MTNNIKAVILAAGEGSRLGLNLPKILLEIKEGTTLLEYHLRGLKKIGIKEVVIVGGYKYNLIQEIISARNLDKQYRLSLVCVDWKGKGNGNGLYQARHKIKGKFLVMMGDLFIDYDLLKNLLLQKPLTIVVDSQPRNEIKENTTKVKIKEGKIIQIKKGNLPEFEAIEFGIALADERIFQFEITPQSDWIDIVAQAIEKEDVFSFDVKGAFWKNINHKTDLEEVKRYLNENNS